MTKREKIIESIKRQTIRLLKEDIGQDVNNPSKQELTTDKDGNVELTAPIDLNTLQSNPAVLQKIKSNPELMKKIQANPLLARKLLITNEGLNYQYKIGQQVSANGKTGIISGLSSTSNGDAAYQVNGPNGNQTFSENEISSVNNSNNSNSSNNTNNNPIAEGLLKEWLIYNQETPPNQAGSQFRTAYTDSMNFQEIQDMAQNPNNLYRNAAQKFLQDLEYKKFAQNIVFILKQRGYIPNSNFDKLNKQFSTVDESISEFQDLLREKANEKLVALIHNNCFIVMFGFYVESEERKHYIQSETWYTIDGHLRNININQFDSKTERTIMYKKILGRKIK